MMPFPVAVIQIIAEYAVIPKLHEWIPKEALYTTYLLANPLSFEAGIFDLSTINIDNHVSLQLMHPLAENPAAERLIRQHIDQFIHVISIWKNPSIPDILIEYLTKQCFMIQLAWRNLNLNPNPIIVNYLINNPERINYQYFSKNPGAIDWLLKHPECIDYQSILANSAAVDHGFLDSLPYNITQDIHPATIDTNVGLYVLEHIHPAASIMPIYELTNNSHPFAISCLKTNQSHINWCDFSSNPGIFYYNPAEISESLISIL